jgi:ABC-type transporter Mla maintaining outer membrane lipid asymmetry ATPase subunit MlaF
MAVVIGGEILELNQRIGATSLVVSHDRELAFGIADRIALICAGEILAVDLPAAIQAHPDARIQDFLTATHSYRTKRNSHEKHS